MYYVTMTDKFMSGWGMAKGRINKLVFVCESYDDALRVESYASSRGEMKNINIKTTKPYYPALNHYTQFKDKSECPRWYRGCV